MITNGNNIEAHRTLFYMARGKKALRSANHDALLLTSHAEFRQRGRILFHRTRSNFHKRQRLSVVDDEAQLALDAAWRVVFRDKHVALTSQIPIRESLAPHARAARFLLLRISALTSSKE